MAKKGTKAEVELRVQTVYEMILKGATRPFIMRYAAEKWDLSERTVDEYMCRARDIIRETFEDRDRERLIIDTIAKLSDLYVKNYTIEDFRECRNILESRSKLLGLNEADKIDVVTEARPILLDITLPDEDDESDEDNSKSDN